MKKNFVLVLSTLATLLTLAITALLGLTIAYGDVIWCIANIVGIALGVVTTTILWCCYADTVAEEINDELTHECPDHPEGSSQIASFAPGDQYYMIHSRQKGLYITPGYIESVEYDTLGNIHYNAKEGAIYPAFYENNIDGLVFANEEKAFDILDELVGYKTSRELGKSYDSATARRKYCERRVKF